MKDTNFVFLCLIAFVQFLLYMYTVNVHYDYLYDFHTQYIHERNEIVKLCHFEHYSRKKVPLHSILSQNCRKMMLEEYNSIRNRVRSQKALMK